MKISKTALLASGLCLSGIAQAQIHTVDILVLHPPKSVLNVDVLTRIASMESYANKALENSQAKIRFNVVKTLEFDLVSPKTDATTLGKLRANTEVQQLRSKYGADIVTMITPTGPYCGVGYVLGGRNGKVYPALKNYAYNVVGDRCITSFAHEIGHNLGLGHSFKQNSRGALYSWGRGHGVDNQFVTTMAYTSAYNARRLQFFSNPDVKKCKGLSCGSPVNRTDGANATQAINVSGPQVAAWFERTAPTAVANIAPTAADDFSLTRKNEAVTIPVLANDVDADQDSLSIESIGAAKHGQTVSADDKIQYIPNAGFVGQDNFQYTINDGQGHTATAWVTVNVGWGTNFQYFQGQWSQLPDFSKLTPVKEGISHNFSLEPRLQDNNFAFHYSAQLYIPKTGQYQFFITSDDGSQLKIDRQLLIDNDGRHPAQTRSNSINLTAGLHSIEVGFFQNSGGQQLQVEWQGPEFSRQLIPSSALRLAEPENSFPVAGDDTVQLPTEDSISINVLSNDTDTDGDNLTITSYTQANHGSVSLENNQLVYQPDSGFFGTDYFTYQISDGRGGEDTALVTVNVGQGMVYEYYQGKWDRLPEFDQLTPVKTGVQKSFHLRNRLRNDYFAFRFKGQLQVPRDGTYYFFLLSDDGSKLNIDNQTIANIDGIHSLRWSFKRAQLTAGSHEFELQYFEYTGRERLFLFWRGPGMRWQRLDWRHINPRR